MFGEFLGAWLSNTFTAVIVALGSLFCLGLPYLFILLMLAETHPASRALVRKVGNFGVALPFISVKYIALVLLLGALWLGAYQTANSNKPSVDHDPDIVPGSAKNSPLRSCIIGSIPNEFREEDKKTLRRLRFEWDESNIDVEGQLSKAFREIGFLEAEGLITPEEAKIQRSSYASQMAHRPVVWQEKWKAACKEASKNIESIPPNFITPASPW